MQGEVCHSNQLDIVTTVVRIDIEIERGTHDGHGRSHARCKILSFLLTNEHNTWVTQSSVCWRGSSINKDSSDDGLVQNVPSRGMVLGNQSVRDRSAWVACSYSTGTLTHRELPRIPSVLQCILGVLEVYMQCTPVFKSHRPRLDPACLAVVPANKNGGRAAV